MARREIGEINAGSMADIAFLLLIFFLVTTTMDKDTGILRLLPPPMEDIVDPPIVKDRNVFEVLANAKDQLLVEGKVSDISELKDMAKEFMTNPTGRDDLPELRPVVRADIESNLQIAKANLQADPNSKEAAKAVRKWENKMIALEELGGSYDELPSSAIISLQNDRGTTYDLYIQVQNELSSAVSELREELCLQLYGRHFVDLDDKNENDKRKIIAIRAKYPQRVSEAEPKKFGGGEGG